MSGGTDLLVQLRAGRLAPGPIIDLKNVAGAQGIRQENGGWIIGAATPAALLANMPAWSPPWPGVVEGANLIGSHPDSEPRAALAGNLCNASPAADSVPALIAARATCIVVGPAAGVRFRSRPSSPGSARPRWRPVEFLLEFACRSRPPAPRNAYLRGHPAHRNGHRCRRAGADIVLDEPGSARTCGWCWARWRRPPSSWPGPARP